MAGKTRKRKKEQTDDVLHIVVDLGNSLLKGMIAGRPETAIVIPHAIKKMTETKFQSVVSRFNNGYGRGGDSTEVSMFGYNGEYAMVGANAEALGADTRRSGGPKYERDYYTFLFLAVLLRLVPQGHENIQVMAAFPPGDINHTGTLRKSLGGRHVVKRQDGSSVTYKVSYARNYDEPVGGLWNYLLAEDGEHYNGHVMAGLDGLGLCVDIGGKISSLVPFQVDGWVDYNNAYSVDLGIQDVMKQVSDILLATPEYHQRFRAVRGSLPFDSNMRNCLKTGIYMAGGYELNALDAIADATTNLRMQLRETYEQELGGSRAFRFVVVTGGGGGLLFSQLVEHVLNFNEQYVHPSCGDLDRMHLSNMFGGNKLLAAMKANGVIP